MKVYRVVTTAYQKDTHKDIFFTSKSKALGYIIGIMKTQKTISAIEHREDGRWYNSKWYYDIDQLFNIRNWNKYDYIINGGCGSLHIEEVQIF